MAVQPVAQEADAEEGTECYVRRTDRQPEPRRSDHRHCRRQSDREGARPVEPGDLRADGADEARPEQSEPEGDAERAHQHPPERDRHLRLYRQEEPTYKLQSLMPYSYAAYCLKKKRKTTLT